MRAVLLYGGLAGVAYVAFRVWKQASTPGAGGTTEALKNWAGGPLAIGAYAALGYLFLTR